jgi:hypothetical protein
MDDTVNDLILAGAAYLPYGYSKLFFAIKDAILKAYGTPDGLDQQHWDDMDFYDQDSESVHAEHWHLLARYWLRGHLFHRPTNEFYYFNYAYQIEKVSIQYFALQAAVKNTIHGKKKKACDREARAEAWRALKRLVKRHGCLLRPE